MPNYQPDLTGEAPENYLTTYQRMVWKDAQKLEFEYPVYQNSQLEIIVVGGTPTPLVQGVDFVVNPNDIHDDAIAFCKSIDNEFNLVLLKSITIVRPFSGNYLVQVKFNQLFADDIKYTRLHTTSDTLEVTPNLVSNMVEQIDYLQQMALNVSEEYSSQSGFAKILEIDMTGTLAENLINTELHDINTQNGVSFINPIYGAYYKDSLIVINVLSGAPLAEQDYRVMEVDIAKTHNSSDTGGVFRSIEILDDFVGQVGITYQAYGGSTDVVSMDSLKDKLIVLENFLSENSFITPGTLHAEPSVINLYTKIADMEGKMRLLLQNGFPNYGDVSTNNSVLKKLVAADDNKHWWSLATLYRVDGSNDNVTADVFKFRIKTLYSNVMLECSVSVNVDQAYSGDKVVVTCDNSSVPDDVLAMIYPELRVIEVDASGVYPGVVLQLGLKLGTGLLQETVAVEDMSGKESCWLLVPFTPNSISPEDTAVLMPDEVSVYTDGAAGNTANVVTIPFTQPVEILRENTNIALNVTDFQAAADNNDTSDRLLQEVGEIDWKAIKSLIHLITLNISGATADIVVDLPVSFYVVDDNLIEFRTEALIMGVNIRFNSFLFYDEGTSSYTMRTVVEKMEGVQTDTTYNLISSKIKF